MLLMNNFNMHVLFDLGATYSFIAKRIIAKLRMGVGVVEKGVHNWNSNGKHG